MRKEMLTMGPARATWMGRHPMERVLTGETLDEDEYILVWVGSPRCKHQKEKQRYDQQPAMVEKGEKSLQEEREKRAGT